jgi:hypothetical protein
MSLNAKQPPSGASGELISKFEKRLAKQVSYVSSIVDRTRTPLKENVSYLRARAEFYGMLSMYQIAGGSKCFKIVDPL